jgi:Holliday junction resolvasome RuvABC endonuclease subunit
MENNNLIGTFGTSKDNLKFMVESIDGNNANIKFLLTGKIKNVPIRDIKNGEVSSKIRKSVAIKKIVITTDFTPKKEKSINKTIRGINLKMLSLDAGTETTGFSIFIGSNLDSSGSLMNQSHDKFIRIRYMCDNIERLILENNINHIVLEDIYLGDGIKSFLALANLQGALIDLFLRKNIPYTLILASEWKGYYGILTKREVGKIKAIDMVESLTGTRFQEDESESIAQGIYAIKEKVNWFS